MKPVATIALKFLRGYPQETLIQVQQNADMRKISALRIAERGCVVWSRDDIAAMVTHILKRYKPPTPDGLPRRAIGRRRPHAAVRRRRRRRVVVAREAALDGTAQQRGEGQAGEARES